MSSSKESPPSVVKVSVAKVSVVDVSVVEADVEIARSLDRLLRRLQAGLNQQSAEFDTYQVGPGGGMVLMAIADLQPVKAFDLVEALKRDKSQMTRTIKALENKGLVTRTTSPKDARVSILSLTQAGSDFVLKIEQAVAFTLDPILAPLSSDEKKTFCQLLAKL